MHRAYAGWMMDESRPRSQTTHRQTRLERWASRLEWLQGIEAVQAVLTPIMQGLRLLGRLVRGLME